MRFTCQALGVSKTILRGPKLLGAYFKAYFDWTIECQLSKTLKPNNKVFQKMLGTISKDAP